MTPPARSPVVSRGPKPPDPAGPTRPCAGRAAARSGPRFGPRMARGPAAWDRTSTCPLAVDHETRRPPWGPNSPHRRPSQVRLVASAPRGPWPSATSEPGAPTAGPADGARPASRHAHADANPIEETGDGRSGPRARVRPSRPAPDASGGIGGGTVSAPARRGRRAGTLPRRPADARERRLDRVGGDAMEAAEDASVVVHAANPPGYRDRNRLPPRTLDGAIGAARGRGARVARPGTIWNDGRGAVPLLAETRRRSPRGKRGPRLSPSSGDPGAERAIARRESVVPGPGGRTQGVARA